jgi:hypothetical protein
MSLGVRLPNQSCRLCLCREVLVLASSGTQRCCKNPRPERPLSSPFRFIRRSHRTDAHVNTRQRENCARTERNQPGQMSPPHPQGPHMEDEGTRKDPLIQYWHTSFLMIEFLEDQSRWIRWWPPISLLMIRMEKLAEPYADSKGHNPRYYLHLVKYVQRILVDWFINPPNRAVLV